MKRLFLAFIICLFTTLPALAAETRIYTGTASKGNEVLIHFYTNRVGPVIARAQWQPRPGGQYWFDIKHLLNPADTFSYDQWAGMGAIDDPPPPPQGDWSLTILEGKQGYWTARFQPWVGGKVSATITITAETD